MAICTGEEKQGAEGHLRSAVSVISVGNGADAGFIGVLFSFMPCSMVSVHTDNSIYSDVPWHNQAKRMEQQSPSLCHPDKCVLDAFGTNSFSLNRARARPWAIAILFCASASAFGAF